MSDYGLFENVYNPDVLTCLANLSSDEVFTPPDVANAMLDMLPQELFRNPDTTFLDPGCKSGVFLFEIAKRLLKGLEPQIPDLQERIDHIFHKQLFGIAITELTSLLSRRSVYCSKYADSEYSVSHFENADGNIRYKRIRHKWKNGKCVFCGVSQSQYKRGDDLETHAYEWIHTLKPGAIFNMKFDVIISNPPYQLNDGGNGVSATPIFQHFVESAIKLNPRYLTMIIPARWYAGGKGLDDFREMMLNNKHISKIVDYESSKDCFNGVNIAGGVCYFLWDKTHDGYCNITNTGSDNYVIMERRLNEFPILIRSNLAVSIVRKVLQSGCEVYSNFAYPRNPFGFATNYKGRTEKQDGDVDILTSKGFQYVKRSEVLKNADIIDFYKVLIGRLVPSNGELDVDPKNGYKVITDTRIIGPGQINTETYLDIGVFKTEQEALNFDGFLKSKLPRFLLRQAISSLNVTRECFRSVQYVDFTQPWNDEKLYKTFGLSEAEIQLVEKTIRSFDNGGEKK